MDLIILAALLPLIIVPIVLLSGFAGCSSFGTASGPSVAPPAPFNLQATAISTDQIVLTWQHNSAGGVEFQVGRQRPDGSWDETYATPIPKTDTKFTDKLLDPGKTYNYRVKAITPGTPSTPSDPSNEKAATTWKWVDAYHQTLTKPPALAGLTYSGDCLVQRIDRALLTLTGTAKKTRLTLRSDTTLTIQNVYISRAIPGTGSNRWQPFTDLARVLSGGIILAANTPKELDAVDYLLTNSEDLLIAFDIASGVGRQLTTGVGTSIGFLKLGTPAIPAVEAASLSRTTTNWEPHASAIFLVERIEVLIA